MKINLHVDASISEEHAEIWVKQMKPNLESMLQYLNNNQVFLLSKLMIENWIYQRKIDIIVVASR